jgi:hypothetical protein
MNQFSLSRYGVFLCWLVVMAMCIDATSLPAFQGSDPSLEETRVHAHMRIPQEQADKPGFYKVPLRMKGLGITTY